MKVNKIIVIILCPFLSCKLLAQDQVKPIEYRFINGENGLRDFLTKNTVTPMLPG